MIKENNELREYLGLNDNKYGIETIYITLMYVKGEIPRSVLDVHLKLNNIKYEDLINYLHKEEFINIENKNILN
jgi:hypothetical protein